MHCFTAEVLVTLDSAVVLANWVIQLHPTPWNVLDVVYSEEAQYALAMVPIHHHSSPNIVRSRI